MNDAEQMVHCYILKVGSMILHTLPFKEVVHNYYNLVELHNTVIVVTNVNYYTYSKVEYQMFYFLSSEYFFFYKTHSCHHWHMKYVKFLICSLQNEIYIHIVIFLCGYDCIVYYLLLGGKLWCIFRIDIST